MSARRRVLESRLPIEPDPPEGGPTPAPFGPDSLEPANISLGSPLSLDRARGSAPPSSLRGGPASRRSSPSGSFLSGPSLGGASPGAPLLGQGNRDSAGPAAPRTTTNVPVSRWLGRERPGAEGGSAEIARGASPLAMSPRMTALFGGLFGLATVTTIIALLIQGAPPRDDRAATDATASASGAAAGEAAGAAPEVKGPKKRVRTKVPGPWRIADIAKEPGVRILEDTMNGRSFTTALNDKGVPKDQVYRVIKAFDGVRSFDKTSKKDRFIVAIDRQTNRVKAFEFVVSAQEVYQAKEENEILQAARIDMKIAEEEVVGSFYVGKNLTRSMEWGGFEPDLTRVIDEAFGGKISSDGFEEGGTVRVVATEVTALGEFVRYKNIVAIEYQPPDPSAPPLRAYTYQGTGARGYFDERGRQPDGSGWASPVPGAPITSRYNPKRLHPVLKKVMPHNGTDYGAPTGTPVFSVFRGKVTSAGWAGPCGNMVAIMHSNGIESGYCHLSKITPGLKVGQTIGTRQVIGQVGTTGRSTGPHLHFWTKKNNQFFDSETLKVDGFRVIPAEERAAFAARKTELDGRLDGIEKPEPPPTTAPAPSAAAGDDTRPNIGASGEDGDDSPSPAPASSSTAKSSAKSSPPASVDPGDGDEIMGADLRK